MDNAAADTFGSRLRFARNLRRQKQAGLAAAAKTTQPAIARIERGQTVRIRAEIAGALAVALDVSLDWLLTGNGRAPTAPARVSPPAPGIAADVA